MTTEVPCPLMLYRYNQKMGGVDKSDQFISYHKVLRKTVKYWKTAFYHLVDIAIVNSHLLYNWCQIEDDEKAISENRFRDSLVLEIMQKYGKPANISKIAVPSPLFKVRHGSRNIRKRIKHVVFIVSCTIPRLSLNGNVQIVP